MSREKRLEFPESCFGRFSPKAKAELEVAGIASFGLKALSVDKKKIVQLIDNGSTQNMCFSIVNFFSFVLQEPSPVRRT